MLSGRRILARNWRTPFAELDIVAVDPDGTILVIEVKASAWRLERGLGRQQARLRRAVEWLGQRYDRPVEALLVYPANDVDADETGESTQSGQFFETPIF